MNVLFVCTGNTCRSPLAAGYFKALCEKRGLADVMVDSAGISAGCWAVSNESLQILEENGMEAVSRTSKPLTQELVKSADLIVTMSRGHRDIILRRYPRAAHKTHMLLGYLGMRDDVEDPVGMPVGAYRETLQVMRPALEALLEIVSDPKVRFEASK